MVKQCQTARPKITILLEWLKDLDKEVAQCDHDEMMLRLPLSVKLHGVIEFLRERRNGHDQSGACLRDVMSFLDIRLIRERLVEQWKSSSANYDDIWHEEFPARAMPARRNADAVPEMPLLPPSLLETSNQHQEHDEDHRQNGLTMHSAMVAQLVRDKAVLKTDECRKALQKEWDALLARECWDIRKAEPWGKV